MKVEVYRVPGFSLGASKYPTPRELTFRQLLALSIWVSIGCWFAYCLFLQIAFESNRVPQLNELKGALFGIVSSMFFASLGGWLYFRHFLRKMMFERCVFLNPPAKLFPVSVIEAFEKIDAYLKKKEHDVDARWQRIHVDQQACELRYEITWVQIPPDVPFFCKEARMRDANTIVLNLKLEDCPIDSNWTRVCITFSAVNSFNTTVCDPRIAETRHELEQALGIGTYETVQHRVLDKYFFRPCTKEEKEQLKEMPIELVSPVPLWLVVLWIVLAILAFQIAFQPSHSMESSIMRYMQYFTIGAH